MSLILRSTTESLLFSGIPSDESNAPRPLPIALLSDIVLTAVFFAGAALTGALAATVFFAGVFFTGALTALAAGFFAAGFLAAVFLAAGLEAVFLAGAAFFAAGFAVFFAGAFAAVFFAAGLATIVFFLGADLGPFPNPLVAISILLYALLITSFASDSYALAPLEFLS